MATTKSSKTEIDAENGIQASADTKADTKADIPAAAKTADVKARGAELGLTPDDLVEMYRLMAVARAVDERMWILNRAGKIPFVISGQGHEGAQVGLAYALK